MAVAVDCTFTTYSNIAKIDLTQVKAFWTNPSPAFAIHS